jgi:hemin uptake protein HemP
MMHPPPIPPTPERQVPPPVNPRRVAVSDLLGGADVVILMHNGQEYRLRLTRANKLILTK